MEITQKIADIRIKILAKRINDKAKELQKETSKSNSNDVICAETLESILDNLEYLLEPKNVDGQVQKYLPLQIKQELFHLIYPNGYIHCNVEMNFNNQLAMAQAFVYGDSKGEITLGEGFADQAVSNVKIIGTTVEQLQACRRIAKGRATSDALRDAGIASWLPDDPAFYDQVDLADADDNSDGIPASISTIPSDEEEPLPFDNDTPDPIRSFILRGGKHPNTSLGDIEQKDPNYLIMMYMRYKDGSWTNVSTELITNLESIIIQNVGHRFDDVKAQYNLG